MKMTREVLAKANPMKVIVMTKMGIKIENITCLKMFIQFLTYSFFISVAWTNL